MRGPGVGLGRVGLGALIAANDFAEKIRVGVLGGLVTVDDCGTGAWA